MEKFDVLTGKFEAFSLFKDGRKRRPTIQEDDSAIPAVIYERPKPVVYCPTWADPIDPDKPDKPSKWGLVLPPKEPSLLGMLIVRIVQIVGLVLAAVIMIPLFLLILGVYGSAVSGMAAVGIPSIFGALILCYAMSRIVK